MVTTTKAIVAREPNYDGPVPAPNFSMEEVSIGEPGEDEVLVEMVASGVCHTDLVFALTPPGMFGIQHPKVLGHEGAGYVRKTGANVTSVAVGDPVLLSFYSCGACEECKDSHPAYCHNFAAENYMGRTGHVTTKNSNGEAQDVQTRFFGQSSFSRYSVVDKSSVLNAKDLLQNDDELKLFAPLGCGMQTGMGAVENVGGATEDSVVVVTGLGSVGLAAVMTAKIRNCRGIIAVDRIPARLELARQLGATHTIDTSNPETKLAEAIGAIFPTGANIAIDTTGVPVVLEGSLQALSRRGKLILIGVPPMGYELPVSVVDQMNTGRCVTGCIEGDAIPSVAIPKMIQWYREGRFPIDKLVTYFEAEDYPKALAGLHSGAVIKAVLRWVPDTLCKE